MAGVLANSVTATMVASDTAESKIVSGYLRNERIALSAYPAGTTYRWTLVNPSGSSAGKAQLSDYTSATPSFVPDVGGTYLVTAAVDDAVYVIRIGAIDTAASDPVEAIRLMPRADAQVQAPSLGQVLYYSSNADGLVAKNPDGSVANFGTAPPVEFSGPSSLVVGGTDVAGVAASATRADHIHGLPAFGTASGTFCEGNDARILATVAVATSGSITVPIGSAYTTALTIATPVADGYATQYGVRIWHRTSGSRIAESWRVHVARAGSNYTLSLEDGTSETTGATPSITDALDSGLGIKAAISGGSLVISLLQGAAARYTQTWVWKTEESNA
jgi:hypothetical protein